MPQRCRQVIPSGLKPDGRESLVVVIKGTFSFPSEEGEEAQLAPDQVPLVTADEFTGEPGFSAPLYETDFSPTKPKCDILLNGSAYAPGGKPTQAVEVSLQVENWSKAIRVVGNRVWEKGWFSIRTSDAEPFSKLEISYDKAFGGADRTYENEAKHKVYMDNPIGVGFHDNLAKEAVQNTPLPNTEEINQPITHPKKKYRPMSFGPIGRAWQQRIALAGTYDQQWVDQVFPFLPADFQESYYQAVSADQQVDSLQGGEKVSLTNLTPQGWTHFRVPQVKVPVLFFLKNGRKTRDAAGFRYPVG